MPVKKAGIGDQGLGISEKETNPQSPTPNPRLLGLIAGMGQLPVSIATEAKKMGYYVVGIALQPPADESLRPVADAFHIIRLGSFGSLLSLLKKLSITEAVMAGKVPKKLLYENKKDIVPDLKAMKLLFSLKDLSDDSIMNAVVGELEKKGVRIHKTTTFTKPLLAPVGVLTRQKPSRDDMKDIEFGWAIARKIGKLDIGQTVVVKNRAVMAVEAIEGTDEAILRGGALAQKDAVVIKVSKPQQDMRFDVPAVGAATLHSMMKARAKVLALEASRCIIIDKDNFLREADKAGISVIGISPDNF
ncbi:MAG: UDP-2,3-diacylglucosamine diphosphatase LpxI [Nitrospirae bacterium]|nr:UDP-2,3-diacylglucosamine diphosphatase LpxI [Nitrospirota bacterium]